LASLRFRLRNRARQARQSLARVRAKAQSHGLVLMYHRITEPLSDPWDLAVSPSNFRAHLEVIRREGVCLPLPDFAARIMDRNRPHRLFAITFDDGYRDNLVNAAPALEAHDLPAAIFVVSGVVGAGRDFWWDALARVFLNTPSLPYELRLDTGAGALKWTLGMFAECTPQAIERLSAWRVHEEPATHGRQKLFIAVWRVLITRPFAEAEEMCQRVLDWAGADRSGPVQDRTLDAEEVGRLARGGLVEVGGHTVTHQPLDKVSREVAIAEIEGCRIQLSEIAGREIRCFSYPFGRFGPEIPGLVRTAGFACACTSRKRLAYPGTDPYRIPRISVPNLDGEDFGRFLRGIVG
jgi:peptidoglycan/xylan/chitin deacetylase (PgdA/CDA1 family)